MLIDPSGKLLQTKVEEPMTRQQAAMFWAFEQMLERMGLSYQLRCRRCNERREGDDYCWGNNLTTASRFVVECQCTTRAYQGADVPLH